MGLFDRLRGDEILRHQGFGAADLLQRQVQAGLGSQDLCIDPGPGVGHADVGALDVVAQGHQGLAGLDRIPALDMQALDQAHDLRADIGDPLRLDQATHRTGHRGCRRCREQRRRGEDHGSQQGLQSP